MNGAMSAFGPKGTSLAAPHMSAFGGIADMGLCGNPLLRSLLRVKRTSLFAAQMSAFDPKRTCCPRFAILNQHDALYRTRCGHDAAEVHPPSRCIGGGVAVLGARSASKTAVYRVPGAGDTFGLYSMDFFLCATAPRTWLD